MSMEGMFKCSNSKELKWSDLIIKKKEGIEAKWFYGWYNFDWTF